jgi:hypothetical protein
MLLFWNQQFAAPDSGTQAQKGGQNANGHGRFQVRFLILKRHPAVIGPERPTRPNQAGWRFVAPPGLVSVVDRSLASGSSFHCRKKGTTERSMSRLSAVGISGNVPLRTSAIPPAKTGCRRGSIIHLPELPIIKSPNITTDILSVH